MYEPGDSAIAFHLDRVSSHGVDGSHLTSGYHASAKALEHSARMAAIMFAGNQEPPYARRVEKHGDSADVEVLLYPDELAVLPHANQLIAMLASGLSNKSFWDR